MSGYESDSSGLSDQEEYTETNVLLGYPSQDPTDDTISHLGGYPSWLEDSKTPTASFAKCKVCKSYMSLLLQLNGDLPEHFPNDERRLYIFSCRRKACYRKVGSIRALREVRKAEPDETRKKTKSTEQEPSTQPALAQQPDLGAALFGSSTKAPFPTGNANPFSMSNNSASSTLTNPFAPLPPTSSLAAIPPQKPVEEPSDPQTVSPETFASKLRVSSPDSSSDSPAQSSTSQPQDTEPWPSDTSFPPPYPSLHLDADYEALSPTTLPPEAKALASKVQYEDETEGPSSSSSKTTADDGLKDNFESTIDRTFLKFSDRLAQNPEQVLRYEWKGTPLLYSSTDNVASRFPSLLAQSSSSTSKVSTITTSSSSTIQNRIPRCEYCTSPRVFELQLVPGLISALEDDDVTTDFDSGMEWGTIILGVCERNCCDKGIGEVGWREEWVGVQWEEWVGK
ncbi:putative pdcd2_c domain [Phaeomoniella chlamydospora]|uniref:Putative pdcd2_c domain n=1 Tax=Phaeomoniella chlamydospora TaxID=158046 RepID=A0A0G2F334_PHACM|nr:putative pdcd2_c domain [Phaeomoniella chlamydospora]